MASPANKRKKNFCIEFAGNNEGNLRVFKHLFKLWCKYTGDEEKEQDNQPAPSKAHWGCKTKSVLCVDLRRVIIEYTVHQENPPKARVIYTQKFLEMDLFVIL